MAHFAFRSRLIFHYRIGRVSVVYSSSALETKSVVSRSWDSGLYILQSSLTPVYPLRTGKRWDWRPDSARSRIQNSSAAWLSVSDWQDWSYKCPGKHTEVSVGRKGTPPWEPPNLERGCWGYSSYWGCLSLIRACRWQQTEPYWRTCSLKRLS